jgi:hypothetical protein
MKKFWIVMIIIGAAVIRLLVIWFYKWDSPNGDEAIAGLMAKHITEGKSWPIFFYGQSYLGALEAYLTALAMWVAGFIPNLVYLVPFVMSVLLIFLVYKFSLLFNNQEISLASAIILAVAPWPWIYGILNAGGFGLATALELVACYTFIRLIGGFSLKKNFLIFCFISGILFWVWQIYIPVFMLIFFFIVFYKPIKMGKKESIVGIGLFILGSLPLWVYNILNQWVTFSEVFGKFAASDTTNGFNNFVKYAIGNRIWNLPSYLSTWFTGISGHNWILFCLLLVGIGAVCYHYWKQQPRKTLFTDPIFIVLGLALVFFLVGHRSTRYLYLIPFLVIPIAVKGWYLMNKKVMWIFVSLTLLGNLFTFREALDNQYQPVPWKEIIKELDSQKITYGYSDFWHAYPITFLSGERIITSVRLNELDAGADRTPAYTEEVDTNSPVFVLLPLQLENSEKIQEIIERDNIRQQEFLDLGLILYSPIFKDTFTRQWLSSH